MPHYEFFCLECKTFFDKILSLVDYQEGDVVCPHCGSKKVEQRWSAFSAITSKKSRMNALLAEAAMRFEGFSFGSLNRRKDVRTRCRNRPRGDPQAKEGPIQEFREQFGHMPLSIEEDIPWKCSQLVIGTGA